MCKVNIDLQTGHEATVYCQNIDITMNQTANYSVCIDINILLMVNVNARYALMTHIIAIT